MASDGMLEGAGGNVLPDVPLGRAWLTVVGLITEIGGRTVRMSHDEGDYDTAAEAMNDVAERVYFVDRADLEGFSLGSTENALIADGLEGVVLSERVQRALTGAVAGALLTGIQLERDRTRKPPPDTRRRRAR